MLKSRTFGRRVTAMAVTLLLGFPMTTELADAKGKPQPPPPPASPPARAWHGFTGNGGETESASRLYLYGGAGSNYLALADFWSYDVTGLNWTYITPNSRSKPGARQWMGWACGGGGCLLANGSSGVGLSSESWYYTEDRNSWARATCGRRAPCPAARQMTTVAYDGGGLFVLFGGETSDSSAKVLGLDDTWTFNPAAMTWTLHDRQTGWPLERNRAAAALVPGTGVMLHGGQSADGSTMRCDLYRWHASTWSKIDVANTPCLHTHSVAWDPQRNRLIVTGGYKDTSGTANQAAWYLPFDNNGVAGQWTQDPDSTGCFAAVKPGARMAFDLPGSTAVFFGGESNSGGLVRYDDTSSCVIP